MESPRRGGREIMVKHPQIVVSTSTGCTAVVVQLDDTLNIIDLLLVTDLEYRAPADAGKQTVIGGSRFREGYDPPDASATLWSVRVVSVSRGPPCDPAATAGMMPAFP